MWDGILNIYKEKGYTSHDVVARLRGILKMKKIGHTGTLDPAAEGVLPVCLGKATKLCEFLTEKEKAYETVLLLGVETDTQDTTGKVISSFSEEKVLALPEERVKQVILSFEGDYAQIPPMYSALKVNGKKLYELAREGKEVERKARTVRIEQIQILDMRLPKVSLRVFCSKGTYIRTLCSDIGKALGVGGCMERLLRIQSGSFFLKDSHTLGEIEKAAAEGKVDKFLFLPDQVFQHRKPCQITGRGEKLLQNGNPLEPELLDFPEGEDRENPVRVYDGKGRFAGLYEYNFQKKKYWPVKLFL